jgi:hypothetical protein
MGVLFLCRVTPASRALRQPVDTSCGSSTRQQAWPSDNTLACETLSHARVLSDKITPYFSMVLVLKRVGSDGGVLSWENPPGPSLLGQPGGPARGRKPWRAGSGRFPHGKPQLPSVLGSAGWFRPQDESSGCVDGCWLLQVAKWSPSTHPLPRSR